MEGEIEQLSKRIKIDDQETERQPEKLVSCSYWMVQWMAQSTVYCLDALIVFDVHYGRQQPQPLLLEMICFRLKS